MPPIKSKKVIVIGGSDPSGGAGIQADLFTLQAIGVSAFSVITAVTAQNENKFISYEPVSTKNFQDQLTTLLPHTKHSIVKIGMLGSGRFIPLLVSWLKKIKPHYLILDPVLRSSTGHPLLDKQGIQFLQRQSLDWVDLITPNLAEAEFLSGSKVHNLTTMENAGRKIRERVKSAVLIKGGHLKGPAVDLLIEGEKIFKMTQPRITGKEVHGTGCTLASAIAGYLCLGKDLKTSIKLARKIVRKKIRISKIPPPPATESNRDTLP
jgi:hydroxymethylpyrimidine/phosphomethylpyrimidine kinase